MSPLISVIIPTYNQAPYLRAAVNSVLNQSITDYEIIIVNDGSTDKTAQILESYGSQLRIIHQSNAGLSAARNAGLEIASGEFVSLLDSDDVLYPNALQDAVAFLQSHIEVDLVCGAWDLIDENGNCINNLNSPSHIDMNQQGDFFRTLSIDNLFPPVALLTRQRCFKTSGCFDTSLKALEDWDMWLRMAGAGFQFSMQDFPMAHYRRHSENMSRDLPRMEKAYQQLLHRLLNDTQNMERLADLRAHIELNNKLVLAQYAMEGGKYENARLYMQSAIQLYQDAPLNQPLNQRYIVFAEILPGGELLRQKVFFQQPSLAFKYYRGKIRKYLKQKKIIRSLFSFVQHIMSIFHGNQS